MSNKEKEGGFSNFIKEMIYDFRIANEGKFIIEKENTWKCIFRVYTKSINYN